MQRLPRPVRAALLVSASAWLGGCATEGPTAVAAQFVRIERNRFVNDGGGAAFYALGNEDEPASLFVDLRYTESGGVDGTRYYETPPGHEGDPPTGQRKTIGASLHLGPTLRFTEWLNVYAGLGIGYREEQVQRFDPTSTLDPQGLYVVRRGERYEVSGSFGVLVRPQEELLFGIGYDTFFEGIVFTVGVVF